MNRNYVVWLQHRVRDLEEELERVENEDGTEDPEMMQRAATVRVHEAKESKFLGPSSGIAITRLIMQLAKQFNDAKSIKEIVPTQDAKQIKQLWNSEQAKPTSKIYPLISDVAADDLPSREIRDLLVKLYKLRVQPMYPALHEPSLDRDMDAVYENGEAATPYQHFVCRMVIAISLQKMDTQYAGLADSYYLAALRNLEPVVQPMDLRTLQCFALMAEYSTLTPTRTAIYYVVGIAVRLAQALGYCEEKTITRGHGEERADPLEIDMRRRLFWCIVVMDYGLAHSLGRPAMLATSQDHLDVEWFETCDDADIKPEGINPKATRPTLKKWIAIHFFKMRMHQLEIRRKLYLRKRTEPRNDQDPWFKQMDAKLKAWRDAVPNADGGTGLDKAWFLGRYNTMMVFLYRPSPQIPRPSLEAALQCFDSCQYNIGMHKAQIQQKNVDVTWIFTQTIFMAINTMLWSLSYEEVRRRHSREEVDSLLDIAMGAIQFAADRWPGVASAIQLYQSLRPAVLKIYEKDGDVPISAATPSEIGPSPGGMFPDNFGGSSRQTSPATVASSSVATPPERNAPPFGHIQQQYKRPEITKQRQLPEFEPLARQQAYAQHVQSGYQRGPQANWNIPPPLVASSSRQPLHHSSGSVPTMQDFENNMGAQFEQHNQQSFDPNLQMNATPAFTPDLTVPGWTAVAPQQGNYAVAGPPSQHIYNPNDLGHHPIFDPNNQAYPFPATYDLNNGGANVMPQQDYWAMDTGNFGTGLNQVQQAELMHDLETIGMEDIQSMISATVASITPKAPQNQHFY